jgi:hypothetical protein
MGVEASQWNKDLWPLLVLLSPNLRLRYRAAWDRAITEILGKVFGKASEAPHHEACQIEYENFSPRYGSIYICDGRDKEEVDGRVEFVYKNKQKVSATIYLPKAEESPYDTDRVVLHQIGHCMGMEDFSDKMSVMWPVVHERPTCFSLNDIQILTSIINL